MAWISGRGVPKCHYNFFRSFRFSQKLSDSTFLVHFSLFCLILLPIYDMVSFFYSYIQQIVNSCSYRGGGGGETGQWERSKVLKLHIYNM